MSLSPVSTLGHSSGHFVNGDEFVTIRSNQCFSGNFNVRHEILSRELKVRMNDAISVAFSLMLGNTSMQQCLLMLCVIKK